MRYLRHCPWLLVFVAGGLGQLALTFFSSHQLFKGCVETALAAVLIALSVAVGNSSHSKDMSDISTEKLKKLKAHGVKSTKAYIPHINCYYREDRSFLLECDICQVTELVLPDGEADVFIKAERLFTERHTH